MANATLSPEVKDVLRSARVCGNEITLTCGRLPATLYKAVDKALTNAGGKWNRYSAAHVFASDPAGKLKAMLSAGVSIDEKKQFQAFYTPKPVCEAVIALAEIAQGMKVLEPSAGIGMLALAARDAGGEVHCIEIQQEGAEALRRLVGLKSVGCFDFLAVKPNRWFDRVVMNPPFANNQDIKHVRHALKFLKPGGVLAAIMFPNQSRTKFQALLDGLVYEITDLPAGAFKGSGTLISAIVLKVISIAPRTIKRHRS